MHTHTVTIAAVAETCSYLLLLAAAVIPLGGVVAERRIVRPTFDEP